MSAILQLLQSFMDKPEPTKYKDKKFSDRESTNVGRQSLEYDNPVVQLLNKFIEVPKYNALGNPNYKLKDNSRPLIDDMDQYGEHLEEGFRMHEQIDWDQAARERLSPKWSGTQYDRDRQIKWHEDGRETRNHFKPGNTSENVLFEELDKFLRSRK